MCQASVLSCANPQQIFRCARASTLGKIRELVRGLEERRISPELQVASVNSDSDQEWQGGGCAGSGQVM